MDSIKPVHGVFDEMSIVSSIENYTVLDCSDDIIIDEYYSEDSAISDSPLYKRNRGTRLRRCDYDFKHTTLINTNLLNLLENEEKL